MKIRSTARWSLAALFLLYAGCASTPQPQTPISSWDSPLLRNHPLAGRIYDVVNQTWISQDAMLERLRATPYILIGEKHDNPDHHRLERWLIEELSASHHGLVFEMLDESQKTGVAALASADSDAVLKEKLAWPDKSWDFAMYSPLIHAGLQHGMQIAVGNPSKAEILEVYKGGKHALSANPRFASALTLGPKVSSYLQDEIFEAHCRTQPREALAPMVQVQEAKDASMAHALRTFPSALLVSGFGHSSKISGVPKHFRDVTQVKVVEFIEVAESGEVPTWYHDVLPTGDYIWFTAKFTSKDYCEGMKSLAPSIK